MKAKQELWDEEIFRFVVLSAGELGEKGSHMDPSRSAMNIADGWAQILAAHKAMPAVHRERESRKVWRQLTRESRHVLAAFYGKRAFPGMPGLHARFGEFASVVLLLFPEIAGKATAANAAGEARSALKAARDAVKAAHQDWKRCKLGEAHKELVHG